MLVCYIYQNGLEMVYRVNLLSTVNNVKKTDLETEEITEEKS